MLTQINIMRCICTQHAKPNHKKLSASHLIDALPTALLVLLTAYSSKNQNEIYVASAPPATSITPQKTQAFRS